MFLTREADRALHCAKTCPPRYPCSEPDRLWERNDIKGESALDEVIWFYLLCGAAVLLLIAIVVYRLSSSSRRKGKTIAEDTHARSDSLTSFAAPDDLSPSHPPESGDRAPAGAAPETKPKKKGDAPPDRELEELLIWHPPALQLASCPCCGAELPESSREPCEVCGRRLG